MRIEMPGKDAGEYYMFTTMDALKEKIRNNPAEKSFYLGNLDDEKYLTLRHRGYVFVMYGKKNPQPAVVEAPLTLEAPKPVTTRVFSDGSNDEPLTYQVVSKLWNDYNWSTASSQTMVGEISSIKGRSYSLPMYGNRWKEQSFSNVKNVLQQLILSRYISITRVVMIRCACHLLSMS